PCSFMIVRLFAQLGLDCLEQAAVEDGRLLPGQNLALEDHLPDVEPVAEQVGKRTAREWNTADGCSRLEGANLGHDALLTQVGHEQAETAEPQIAAEDGPDPVGLGFIDRYLAILGVIAERRHAPDPATIAFAGDALVADTRDRDL